MIPINLHPHLAKPCPTPEKPFGDPIHLHTCGVESITPINKNALLIVFLDKTLKVADPQTWTEVAKLEIPNGNNRQIQDLKPIVLQDGRIFIYHKDCWANYITLFDANYQLIEQCPAKESEQLQLLEDGKVLGINLDDEFVLRLYNPSNFKKPEKIKKEIEARQVIYLGARKILSLEKNKLRFFSLNSPHQESVFSLKKNPTACFAEKDICILACGMSISLWSYDKYLKELFTAPEIIHAIQKLQDGTYLFFGEKSGYRYNLETGALLQDGFLYPTCQLDKETVVSMTYMSGVHIEVKSLVNPYLYQSHAFFPNKDRISSDQMPGVFTLPCGKCLISPGEETFYVIDGFALQPTTQTSDLFRLSPNQLQDITCLIDPADRLHLALSCKALCAVTPQPIQGVSNLLTKERILKGDAAITHMTFDPGIESLTLTENPNQWFVTGQCSASFKPLNLNGNLKNPPYSTTLSYSGRVLRCPVTNKYFQGSGYNIYLMKKDFDRSDTSFEFYPDLGKPLAICQFSNDLIFVGTDKGLVKLVDGQVTDCIGSQSPIQYLNKREKHLLVATQKTWIAVDDQLNIIHKTKVDDGFKHFLHEKLFASGDGKVTFGERMHPFSQSIVQLLPLQNGNLIVLGDKELFLWEVGKDPKRICSNDHIQTVAELDHQVLLLAKGSGNLTAFSLATHQNLWSKEWGEPGEFGCVTHPKDLAFALWWEKRGDHVRLIDMTPKRKARARVLRQFVSIKPKEWLLTLLQEQQEILKKIAQRGQSEELFEKYQAYEDPIKEIAKNLLKA